MNATLPNVLAAAILLSTSVSSASPSETVETALLVPLGIDCQVDSELTDAAQAALKPLYRVRKLGSQTVLSPTQATHAVATSCPDERGILVGGMVQKLSFGKRARLWAVPPGSQTPFVTDIYCDKERCDLGIQLERALVSVSDPKNAASVVLPWTPRPTYCPDPAAPPFVPIERSGKLVVSVTGEKVPKGLLAALTKELSHKSLVHPPPNPKQLPSKDSLVPLLDGDPKGQVLIIDHSAQGSMIMLYDVLTNQFYQDKMVQCPGCTTPQEVAKITESARDHLAHCFDKECPQSARIPPEEACQPWATPLCAIQTPNSGTRHIDPSTAKWVKGAVWSLFAASAATTVTLAILNETSVGQQRVETPPLLLDHTLTKPAWTAGVLTGIAFAIAVPTTVFLHRTGRSISSSRSTVSALACPSQ